MKSIDMGAVSLQELAEQLRDVIFRCIDEMGFVAPLHVIVLALNGSLFALRTHGENPEMLAEHAELNGFELPINMMVIDSQGRAVRIVIASGASPRFIF